MADMKTVTLKLTLEVPESEDIATTKLDVQNLLEEEFCTVNIEEE